MDTILFCHIVGDLVLNLSYSVPWSLKYQEVLG